MSSEPLVRLDRHGAVALLTLDRPDALNALSNDLMAALCDGLDEVTGDDGLRVAVLTGAGRAFAAGADVAAMADTTAIELLVGDRVGRWDRVRRFPKPLIAAVHGFCLGGGCELAMTCDIVIAAEDARFGQPETNLGIIPGAGGTQRTTRTLGKSLTMEMVLAGRFLDADEALRSGLCSRVVTREALVEEALAVAQRIAERPPVAVRLAREAVQRALETTLESGLAFERRSLELAFASDDAHEGMNAFLEKRPPSWTGR
jgi:enoyl-CoA hydratase